MTTCCVNPATDNISGVLLTVDSTFILTVLRRYKHWLYLGDALLAAELKDQGGLSRQDATGWILPPLSSREKNFVDFVPVDVMTRLNRQPTLLSVGDAIFIQFLVICREL